MKLCLALVAAPVLASAKLAIPTKQIADGVNMPMVNIGTALAHVPKPADTNISAIVGNWLDLGGRGIDGGFGQDGRIGGVLAEYSIPRKNLFITTRVQGDEFSHCPGADGTKLFMQKELSSLGTEYVDLLLMQLPDGGKCQETWEAMEDLVRQGKVKALGVTDWRVGMFGEFKFTIPPVVNQVVYNVYYQDHAMEKYCKDNKILLEAWTPTTGSDISSDATIKAIAANHNVSVYQVVLRWIVQKGYAFTFLSSNRDHQANDADVFSFTLEDGEVAKLDALNKKPNDEEATVVV